MTLFFFKYSLLLALTGLCGWFSWFTLFTTSNQRQDFFVQRKIDASLLQSFFTIFLTGFAVLSLVLVLLAFSGFFNLKTILVFFILSGAWYFYIWFREKIEQFRLFALYVCFVSILILTAYAMGIVMKPAPTFLRSADRSIYLGAAYNLYHTGSIKYTDGLVLEMSGEERKTLFKNRFPADATGEYARFPGGVHIANEAAGIVSFRFAPLFPSWLALSLIIVGEDGFLRLLSLFSLISFIALYLLGRSIQDRETGVGIVIVSLFFYPQLYYSIFPSSELLSQALFLSGLYLFLTSLAKTGQKKNPYGKIAALLWGALFLCRIDALIFIPIALIISAFILRKRFVVARNEWRVPFSILLFCLSATVFYQFSNGSYLDLFYIFLPVQPEAIHRLSSILVRESTLAFVVFSLLIIPGIVLLNKQLFDKGNRIVIKLVQFASLLFAVAGLSRFVMKFDIDKIVRHTDWIVPYIPISLLLILSIGILIQIFSGRFKKEGILVVLVFFSIPTFCYLVDPMVTATQPWAARRFVPMIFPLFLLLSLAGWQVMLNSLPTLFENKYISVRMVLFYTLTIALSCFFYSKSSYLLNNEFHSQVIPRLRAMEKQLPEPENSIIIIPDTLAGWHTQIAVQYMLSRDVLLLPVNSRDSQDLNLERVMLHFLHQQLKAGKKILLLENKGAGSMEYLSDYFSVSRRFEQRIAFNTVEEVKPNFFPDTVVRPVVNYVGYDLAPL